MSPLPEPYRVVAEAHTLSGVRVTGSVDISGRVSSSDPARLSEWLIEHRREITFHHARVRSPRSWRSKRVPATVVSADSIEVLTVHLGRKAVQWRPPAETLPPELPNQADLTGLPPGLYRVTD